MNFDATSKSIDNQIFVKPKSIENINKIETQHSLQISSKKKTNNFLFHQAKTYYLNQINLQLIKNITYTKYFPESKSFLLVNNHYELYLLSTPQKKPVKLIESIIKSRILSIGLIKNSLLILGHLNGFMSLYQVNKSFSTVKYMKKIMIFKTFPINSIIYDTKSALTLISSLETNKILVYEYEKTGEFELIYLIRRNDLGNFRAALFVENFIENQPNILISSTASKLHIFNPNKRENHEFLRTKESIISLEINEFMIAPEIMILGCSVKNNVYFWNFDKKDLVFMIYNEEKDINLLYYVQIKTLNYENFWMKLLIYENNRTPFQIELWDREKRVSALTLPQTMLTRAKIEINNKEILQIFYVTYKIDKQKTDRYIVTAGDDFMIRIYSLRDLTLVKTWQASHLPITSIVVITLEDKLLLASASYNNIIQIWNFFQGDVPIQSLASHTLDVNCLLFIDQDLNIEGSSKYLVSGSADKTIILWVYDPNFLFKKLSQAKASETSVIALEYLKMNEKEQFLAVGSRDKNIKIFSLPKLQFLRDLVGHKDSVKSLLKFYRPKSFFDLFYHEKLIDAFQNQNIYINANDMIKSSETPFGNNNNYINSFLDQDIEIFLISGSMDKTIKIWDIFNGVCLYTVHGHEGYINALIWLEDQENISNRMASASQDGTIKIWDMTNLVCLDTFPVDFPRFSSGLCYVKEENIIIYTNYKGEIKFLRLFLQISIEILKDQILLLQPGKIGIIEEKNRSESKCCIF